MANSRSHARHASAMSTSSVILSTSASTSPSASPASPRASGEGLSRRLSWNRAKEEHLSVGDARPVGLGMITSTNMTSDAGGKARPHSLADGNASSWGAGEEYDLGMSSFHQHQQNPWRATEGAGSSRAARRDPHHPSVYFHRFDSQVSLESADLETPPNDVDNERLAFAPPPASLTPGLRHRRVPSRAYDEHGNPRGSSLGQKVAGAVSRNPTFRNVSRTLRKASVRVVNIMGADERGVSLDSGDEREMEEVNNHPNLPDGIVEEPRRARPDALPPEEGRLRGRTLGLFGPGSHTRRAMDRLLRYPFTEPVILMLIIVNVIVLAIQAASPLNTPRQDDGYFQSWEDVVLLALFAVFTLEMFARIIVTGFIFDPETSFQEFLFSPSGVLSRINRRLNHAQPTLQRSSSKILSAKSAWRNNPNAIRPPTRKQTTILSEAPFQQALAKQQALSAQQRPYIRHSWHRVDMIAVSAFWITFLLALTGQEATASRHIYIFRALSVLRAGRLLVITSGTTTILHSLKRAGRLLITVSFFLIFAFGLFSIIGVQSFRGSFRRHCVLMNLSGGMNDVVLEQTCGGHLDAFLNETTYLNLDGTISKVGAKGYICPVNQVCMTLDENPNGGGNSFDNVFASLVQVIIITSINTWAPIMYMAMDTDFFSSAFYFLVAVIILNFWFINLLTAVVVNTFKDIRGETKKSAFGADDHTVIGDDSTWTQKSSKKRNAVGVIMGIYQKTELFWVGLVLADLVAQACKTARSSPATLDLLKNLELAFTFAFDLEMIIRLTAHFPNWRLFLSRGRNDFDLFLAISCSIIQIPAILSSGVYPWLTVFQLLRWYRVILAFPRMRPLLTTVFGSFAGLLNMIIFLFLINFIGALMAVQLFRGDIVTDETITLSHTYNAFLGMYQIFSSEDWTTVLYSAMSVGSTYSEQWLAALFFCGWFLFANAIVLQMFIAVINENFAVAEEQKRKRQIEEFIRRTEPVSAHASWIDRLNPYRLMKAHRGAVRVETLPPNLVLPLKQNVGPDVGSLPERYAVGSSDKGSKGAMRRLFGRKVDESATSFSRLRRPRSARFEDLDDGAEDDRGLSELLPPLNAGPSVDEHMDALRERRNQQADFITAHPSFDQSLWLFKQTNPIRRFCQSCVAPAYGERIFGRPANPTLRLVVRAVVFCTIVASVVIAAIATPEYRKGYYEDHGITRGTWFDLVEVALGLVFILEALIKVIADGFMFAPNAYLLSLWNVLDFLILITLLVNTTTSLIYIGGLSRVTRSLKAFRALRLITLFARLRDTLHAVLFAGALKILDASILMILYIIPFAVWGLNIFAGLLFSCNDPAASGLSACIGEFIMSPVDDSLGYLVPRVWSNPTLDASVWDFDTFRESVLILFEIVSLEGWINVMSSAMNIVGRDLQPRVNASQGNAVFFLLFNLLGGVVILTLFLSVIIGNFSTRSGDALLTREQRHWVDLRKFIKAQTPSQLPRSRPQIGLRAWCYDRAVEKDGWWAQGFTAIYYIHILLLMTETYSNNILNDVQLDWIFLFLTMLYAFDLLIRFFGLGFKSFRMNGWNLFDVVVITGSFGTTIPALRASSKGLSGSEVVTQLQKLFLVAISFKLVQRISSLNQLFKTSVASLPAIGNLFLLWATLFIFFAILNVEVFGLTKQGNNEATRFQNYYSFGNALIMLAFMSTGEGWNGYMHDFTLSCPRCSEDDNYLISDCGSPAWAFGLFISWNILSMYIFMNMFTGVVVESFAYVYQMPGGASLNREEMRAFKRLWAEFDVDRTGHIRRKDFVRFFSRLSGVFEVRLYPTEFSIPSLLRSSIPDPVAATAGRLLIATGVRRVVDVKIIENRIGQIDYGKVRDRRRLFARLLHEARISEEPGRGISFTAMLMLLAHYKLIDDEKALLLDDLLVRREKTARVTDLVNLERVRGLLRTLYWRRRFLTSQSERRRTLNAPTDGIPAIVLEPIPATPPMDEDKNPFDDQRSRDISTSRSMNRDASSSPPLSRSSRAATSPEMRSVSLGHSADVTRGTRGHSPSLSFAIGTRLGRSLSNSSMLSEEDAHYRRGSPIEEQSGGFIDSMATSVWSDMMRQAEDQEERR